MQKISVVGIFKYKRKIEIIIIVSFVTLSAATRIVKVKEIQNYKKITFKQ